VLDFAFLLSKLVMLGQLVGHAAQSSKARAGT
jgi:hypothetical protein